ncbi:hypothetical protein Forpe1208_v004036 [Fusarium oxysporum f. sp. rapae]|uniref:Uncharacterized protein n=1 Tax=Fusarium oxysporum f. sp. rapae TaxID=485398 RepID=A0A8J5PF09_FUSOX|nr:hypothetical protein Forpe1208_v004036 [Fusarium oxysporum f. sp. rapae]
MAHGTLLPHLTLTVYCSFHPLQAFHSTVQHDSLNPRLAPEYNLSTLYAELLSITRRHPRTISNSDSLDRFLETDRLGISFAALVTPTLAINPQACLCGSLRF